MGCKILLADDSITIQKVVNLTFDDEGIEVVAVSNGDQAERKLGEVDPDLVLADIFMPGKNGYELCELIKKNPQFSNVPVVLLVGAFEPFDLNEARRVGADDHLTKPFESRKLVETVRRLISNREQSRPKQQDASAETVQEIRRPAELAEDRSTDSFEDRSERTTDPLDAKPFAQSFNIDLADPSLVDSEAPSQQVSSDVSDLNESAPLELDYSGLDQTERTGDLSTDAFQDEIAFETTPLEEIEFPVNAESAPVMLDTDGRAGEGEEPHSFSFGEDGTDFEKLDSGEPPQPETVFALDVDTTDSAGASLSRETREWASDTTGWQPSLHETSRMEMPGGSSYAAGEPVESAQSTLLAVEDPLGDVLMDEAPAGRAVVEGRWQPAETTEGAELNLDFSSPEAAPLPPISEVAPEYAVSHEEAGEAGAEPQAAEEPSAEQAPATPELVFNPEGELQTEPPDSAEPQVEEPQYEEAVEQTEEAGTESAQPYYAVDQGEEPGQETAGEQGADGSSAAPPAEFTSSAMWTEEESRFAPIDIEAVPVDEAVSQAATPSGSLDRETGFEFSQVMTEATEESSPAPEHASEHTAASEPGSQVLVLSQATIEEIVRRVVSELSDRVVREIAWEVVPDLVERVVERLARESISKRS